jgi:isocitrate dehydrogenase kinase/phosphatase
LLQSQEKPSDPPEDVVRDVETREIATARLSELDRARTREERVAILGDTIVAVFDHYYWRSRRLPHIAKRAFEERNWPEMAQLSRDRLAVYGASLATLAPLLKANLPIVPDARGLWVEIEAHVLAAIKGRYEADLAFAYLRSVQRAVVTHEWTPVSLAGQGIRAAAPARDSEICRIFSCEGSVSTDLALSMLDLVAFNVAFRDLPADAALVAGAINAALAGAIEDEDSEISIVMVDAGFFRNRGAYLIGRVMFSGGAIPLCIALLNDAPVNEGGGITVDAVLLDEDSLQFVFSSTLANFHVTHERYHALAHFLSRLMPRRPLGLHYSTIGFNHVGKVAVMAELKSERIATGEPFGFALGSRGTVAIGFSTPSSRYVLKVIRNLPASGYKWDRFPGVDAVLAKYKIVHESDRAGSMLDNVLYDHVRLDAEWFSPALRAELAAFAGETVTVSDRYVTFRHLIVQMKMIPVPEYVRTAPPALAEAAIVNLGTCIKNNAAANIFNKDLDARNYGVSPIGKVHLFDYDAVEPLTDVKVRTNAGRFEGEEDVPDWVFETGIIFLPEEMLPGLRIEDAHLRRVFRQVHGDLLTVGYWEGMQSALRAGLVPKVRAYPLSKRLVRG